MTPDPARYPVRGSSRSLPGLFARWRSVAGTTPGKLRQPLSGAGEPGFLHLRGMSPHPGVPGSERDPRSVTTGFGVIHTWIAEPIRADPHHQPLFGFGTSLCRTPYLPGCRPRVARPYYLFAVWSPKARRSSAGICDPQGQGLSSPGAMRTSPEDDKGDAGLPPVEWRGGIRASRG